jgi:electron transfer flavoprotein alpha/beta subunit
MQAKQKPVEQPMASDLGFSADQIGTGGSAQRIVAVRPAPERSAGLKIQDEGEAHLEIVKLLEQAKVI